jgi:hypothetical protein
MASGRLAITSNMPSTRHCTQKASSASIIIQMHTSYVPVSTLAHDNCRRRIAMLKIRVQPSLRPAQTALACCKSSKLRSTLVKSLLQSMQIVNFTGGTVQWLSEGSRPLPDKEGTVLMVLNIGLQQLPIESHLYKHLVSSIWTCISRDVASRFRA